MGDSNEIFRRVSEACAARSRQTTEHCLDVRIGEQKLYHFRHGAAVRTYTISTSRAPWSCIENSLGTPTGLHEIADKIGADAPPGMVFKSRVPTGWTWREAPPEEAATNFITSRILRLRGLEPCHNAGPGRDSYDRYIYIHGTSQPHKLGTPNSHGCVLLSDAEVIELFDAVPEGSLVWIE
jgi:L,D-transpeptidase catalytic domain